MINETYLSLVNAYYDTIKPPSKKVKANMKKYRKLLKDKEDYTKEQYKSEYAKIFKELFDVIGKENLTKIFKEKIKKIYEIKKRPLNVDLDKYDSLSIEKIYNSIYSTLTDEEKKRVLSKTNKKVYKMFNKEEYKEAKKDRMYNEIKDQIMQSSSEGKKEVLNPTKQKPVIVKSQNQNQTFKLPNAFYQQKTEKPEIAIRTAYNKRINEDLENIKKEKIDKIIDLNLDGEGTEITDLSKLGNEFKKCYENFKKTYRELIRLKEKQQRDYYDISDLDRKYYIEKYKEFMESINGLIDAYNDCGIIEARELIKLHREIIKTLREKYNVKPKEEERKKDKEGDDVMEDPEEVEENDNEAPIELNKTELSKYLKYIKKDKLFEYQKLYGIINGNEKLKNLITSEARCILFAPSKVKDAIKYNENMEIEEPAPPQQEEEPVPQQQQEEPAPQQPEEKK